jgi:tyrosyl-tRNA synthetase
LDLTTLEASLEGMEMFEVVKADLENGIPILDLLAVNTTIFPSKGEARKLIQSNGFAFNKTKETDPNLVVSADKLLHGKYLIAQKGKKQYYLIKAI